MNTFHRLRNGECLTVIMFHRVLPLGEQERCRADPEWTITPEFLTQCVDFFSRNYAIVSLEDIFRSRRHIQPLPMRPLLITFDDGWRDNLDWAHSTLRGLPWALFVATDAAALPHYWWHEVLLWTLRSGCASYDRLARTAHESGATILQNTSADELQLLHLYDSLPAQIRNRVLAPYQAKFIEPNPGPQMLSVEELKQLQSEGVSIGAHGASHLPLSEIRDPHGDLVRARAWLEKTVGSAIRPALSFPHGRWNSAIAKLAREVGYELLFSSDPVLNRCPHGWLDSDVIGRIPVRTHDVADPSGQLAPDRLAGWLYGRERKAIHA